jgi:signal transduction histidine kinase
MRFRPGLWVALDYAIGFLFAVIIFGVMFKGTGIDRFPVSVWYTNDWLPPVLAVCLAIPAALRRRGPLGALAMIVAACVVIIALGGEITRGPFLPLAFVLYLVAATCRRTVAVWGLAVSLTVLAVQGAVLHLNGWGSGNAVAAGLVMIICWMVGYAVQQRRAYAAHLRDQVATAAVTEERLRIARELHDVVAHSMTVVAVQAGFGEYVFDTQPGEARAALGAIQTVSREALSDMQRLLGVLRQAAELGEGTGDAGRAGSRVLRGHAPDAAGQGAPSSRGAGGAGGTGLAKVAAGARDGAARAWAPLAPAPALADLDRLMARTAGAGVQVAIERTGSVRDIPAGIDLSAYRIVQEALTNVVKHSGAATCHVVIGYGISDLSVEITDLGPGARAPAGASARHGAPLTMCAGHGIIGMRERVGLCGGEFSAAPLPDQGFRVTARLPLDSAAL